MSGQIIKFQVPKTCYRCRTQLVLDDNWSLSRQKRRNNICTPCARKKNNSENATARGRWSQHRRTAKFRGIAFSLTLSEYEALLSRTRCEKCNKQVQYNPGRGLKPNSHTVDRINNDNAYLYDNCAVLCYECNSAKAGHTLASLQEWRDWILSKIQKRKVEAA